MSNVSPYNVHSLKSLVKIKGGLFNVQLLIYPPVLGLYNFGSIMTRVDLLKLGLVSYTDSKEGPGLGSATG